MDPQASLGGRRREAVGVAGPDKLSSPGRCLAGEVISGELGEGIKGEKRENCEDAGEGGDQESCGRVRGGGGDGGACVGGVGSGGGGGVGLGDAMEV